MRMQHGYFFLQMRWELALGVVKEYSAATMRAGSTAHLAQPVQLVEVGLEFDIREEARSGCSAALQQILEARALLEDVLDLGPGERARLLQVLGFAHDVLQRQVHRISHEAKTRRRWEMAGMAIGQARSPCEKTCAVAPAGRLAGRARVAWGVAAECAQKKAFLSQSH